jgi:MFS family permease
VEAHEDELMSPYRDTGMLWRIHALSALMVMPQSMTVTFMLVWLHNDHGWSIEDAGTLVTITALLGAVSRIVAGRWSDLIGSRMRPIRLIAFSTCVAMMLLAFTNDLYPALAVAMMVAASVITVMDNGLEATAITEVAGQFWSGRALGVQNTTQRLMTLTGPPMFGAIIGIFGYPAAFAVCALFPLAAGPVVPTALMAPGFEDSGEQQPSPNLA